MNDNSDLSPEKLTPAQRRLVEDDIKVYPPEEAADIIERGNENYADRKHGREERRQRLAEDDKAGRSEER